MRNDLRTSTSKISSFIVEVALSSAPTPLDLFDVDAERVE